MACHKVVFLDIDGVLNSLDYLKRSYPRREGTKALDPIALKRLETLLLATDAAVVLSSTWRMTWSLPDLQFYFYKKGMSDEVTQRLIGATPTTTSRRGQEIEAWLRYAPPIQTFIILDDDSDMDQHMDRLIKTDQRWGLLDEHVQSAVEMLGKAT